MNSLITRARILCKGTAAFKLKQHFCIKAFAYISFCQKILGMARFVFILALPTLPVGMSAKLYGFSETKRRRDLKVVT